MNALHKNLEKINLPSSVNHYREPDRDIVTWVNKDLPKDILTMVALLLVIFVFLLLFTLLGLGFLSLTLSTSIVSPEFKSYVLAFGICSFLWLVIVYFAISALQSFLGKEMLAISDRSIVFYRKGFWTHHKRCFRKEKIIYIFYGRFNLWNEGQLGYSINIVYRYKLLGILPGIQHEELAMFSRKKEKYQLFLYLQTILQERGWPTVDGTKN